MGIKVSLQALTKAALILPGMFSSPAPAAEGDEVDFQYSHYQEGKRDISFTNTSIDDLSGDGFAGKSFNPIEVDSLHGSARISLTDRVKFAFNYLQDTWGGATPSHTLPFVTSGNSAVRKNDVIVGSTPYATVGIPLLIVDSRLNPLVRSANIDPTTGLPIFTQMPYSKLTHVMATASPETRKQGDFKLSYDWDDAAINVGGGISIEDDYESRFGNLGARLDFNQKQTAVNADLSYTNSETNATLDHDSYVEKGLIPKGNLTEVGSNQFVVNGIRQDWSTHLGITQVINKDAILGADFNYTRSTGYLSNPYKGVAIGFVNPEDQDLIQRPIDGQVIRFYTQYEKRPEVRNQWQVGGRYIQYIEPLDAALHFNYNFSADDWGIQSHTLDADWVQPLGDGWTVTPRVRYYSQDAADFYSPYLVTPQAYSKTQKNNDNYDIYIGSDGKEYSWRNDPVTGGPIFDANGLPIYFDNQGNAAPSSVQVGAFGTEKSVKFDPKKLPTHYSSDHRLSGYGTLSGGITIAKQFAKGLTLETGFEYYTHQGGLKIGGGGEGSYADFDYWLANAALKVNLDALALGHGGDSGHAGHHHHHSHAAHAPAGVMFDHMLPAGGFMAGYRYMWSSQSGNMLNGTGAVNDAAVVGGGCIGPNSLGCFLTPDSMTMSMHMLDLMYAPTDWLTLMLMPQFVDMEMGMRQLAGAPTATNGIAGTDGHIAHHTQNSHETGGIGDLGMYALFKVFDNGTHHLHATAGLSAPTGDVNLQLRRTHTVDGGYYDYGMQLGSGTWDFKPSVTYTGHADAFSWGAQASGTVRMESKNDSGYRLGDIFQGTVWGGYNLNNWLTASVRGVYTVQGSIQGQYTGSAGGQFVDRTENITKVDENGEETVTETQVPSSILKFGPNDHPQNYGGRFWDVGFGLSAMVPSGDFAGNTLSVEWLQPVHTDFNGYQLDRDGALSATWSVMF